MSLATVLASGIDTLEVGFYGKPNAEWVAGLVAQLDARTDREPLQVTIGGLPHSVRFASNGWRIRLECEDVWAVLIALRSPKDQAPDYFLEFRSELLWAQGVAGAVDVALATLWPQLGEPPHRSLVSRVDLATDWLDWSPVPEDTPHFVRRVRFASANWEPAESARRRMMRSMVWQVVAEERRGRDLHEYAERVAERAVKALGGATRSRFLEAEAEADAQEFQRAWWVGKPFTGWEFGRGDVRARIYRKDLEIRGQSGKWWFFDLWAKVLRRAGDPRAELMARWSRNDKSAREDFDEPAWRLEYQLRRNALREFKVNDLPELYDKAPSLWKQLAGEWITLRRPTADQVNRWRWKVRPEWAQIRDAGFRSDREPLVRERVLALNRERSAYRAGRALAAVAVLTSDAPTTLEDAIRSWLPEWKRQLELRRKSWPSTLAEQRATAARPAVSDSHGFGMGAEP